MSGRSCSRAMTAFFITQPLRVHERPYRAIADLETTLRQLADQAAQREVAAAAPLNQPVAMLTPDPLRPVSTDLRRHSTTRGAKAPIARQCSPPPETAP